MNHRIPGHCCWPLLLLAWTAAAEEPQHPGTGPVPPPGWYQPGETPPELSPKAPTPEPGIGDVLPIDSVLERLRADHPGRVTRVELEAQDGRHVYELDLVDPEGRSRTFLYDAHSGEALGEAAAEEPVEEPPAGAAVLIELPEMVQRLRRLHGGGIIEVELERGAQGYYYEVRMVDEDGAVWDLHFDARDGSELSRRLRGEGDPKYLQLLQAAGDVMPLEALLDQVAREHPGRLIEVELERKGRGYVYELELIDERGRVWELDFDARTGELLKKKREK